MRGALVCAVDVGSGSARAGIFDRTGTLLGRGEHPILVNRPGGGHAEHDSENIWASICAAVRQARAASGADAGDVAGIGFDATCSLVARDIGNRQLTISTSGERSWDTIMWLDHRAIAEADECTAGGHPVLARMGGAMSPEMQVPKLMWLKRNLPQSWAAAGRFLDLADFLTFRATGNPARSLCTLACKWTYAGHEEPGWRQDFLDSVGLEDLVERAGLPQRASPAGADLGPLEAAAADALGLSSACRVASGLVDAYAGTLGALGALAADREAVERHVALIAGTSSCVMAISRTPRMFAGGWGPYWGVTLPGLWMIEGGQSATGALLDHIIRWHGAGGEPDAALHRRIGERIMALRATEGPDTGSRIHILPDFHGNRSPLADPHALGVISGLELDASFDNLCRLYWRACVAIALGVRHILDTIRQAGFAADTLHVAGGHARNPLLMELYTDAAGCRVVEPLAEDPVLLGSAMAGAAAAGLYPSLAAACAGMHRGGRERTPDASARARLERDYRVFLAMHRHRKELERMERIE